MKPTDFSTYLSTFLTLHLPTQRNVSPNTVRAYRDAFVLFLRFLRDGKGLKVERVRLDDVTAPVVRDFLTHLEADRHSGISTRNHRLTALHSFFRWLQTETPERVFQCQQILAVPPKRCRGRLVEYLSTTQLKAILEQPDFGNGEGRRDAVLLSMLYDTGARVQELCDLRVRDVRLESPALVRLLGKGGKERAVPLMESTARLLASYMGGAGSRLPPNRLDDPLFCNHHGKRLTRFGVAYILAKYVDMARNSGAELPTRISPHLLRHSKAMHMLQSGVPIVIIRDFLGHSDISTTEIYARADIEMKRRAIENLPSITPQTGPTSWRQDADLLDWLRSL